MRLVSSTDAAAVLDVTAVTMGRWTKLGILKPTLPAHGTGRHAAYSIADLLAVAVGRHLRQRGLSLKQAGNVLQWLWRQDLEDMQADWAAGRRLLLTVGNAEPLDRLVSREELARGRIDLSRAIDAECPVVVIDLAGIYNVIVARLDAIEAERKAPTETAAP